jgi:hypothetical protein
MRAKIREKLKLERAAKNLQLISRDLFGKEILASKIISFAKQSQSNRELVYSTLEGFNFYWDANLTWWFSNLDIPSWIMILSEEHIEDYKLKWAEYQLQKVILQRYGKEIRGTEIISYAQQSQTHRETVYSTLENFGFRWNADHKSWENTITIPAWMSEVIAEIIIEHETDRP